MNDLDNDRIAGKLSICGVLPYVWWLGETLYEVGLMDWIVVWGIILLVVGSCVHAFTKSIVVYMLWGLASPWGIIFLFEFSCHFVIFAFSCDMSGIFTTHKIVRHSLTSTSYVPFTATMKASASSTTTLSLVKVRCWWKCELLGYVCSEAHWPASSCWLFIERKGLTFRWGCGWGGLGNLVACLVELRVAFCLL